MKQSVFDELKWRGLIYDATENVPQMLASGPVAAYNGFDATADSLHVGHMVPLIALARLQRFGHIPIAVAGGGTSMIGDPSGKSETRKSLTTEEVAENAKTYQRQIFKILDPDKTKIVFNSQRQAQLVMSLDLREVDLREAKLSKVNFRNADLGKANLFAINLREADLTGANLIEANLCDANLRSTNFRKALLKKSDLSGAKLFGAILNEAELYKADLTNAILWASDLSKANLWKSNFSNVTVGQTIFIDNHLHTTNGLEKSNHLFQVYVGKDNMYRSFLFTVRRPKRFLKKEVRAKERRKPSPPMT